MNVDVGIAGGGECKERTVSTNESVPGRVPTTDEDLGADYIEGELPPRAAVTKARS
jgi:hypothetical protein